MMLSFTAGFLILLTVLLMERYYDSSSMRNWSWVEKLHQVLDKRFAGRNDIAMVLILALPPAVLVFLIDIFLRSIFYGVLGIVFEWLLLLYCLGPRSLWQDSVNWQQTLESDSMLAKSQQAVEEDNFVRGLWLVMERRIVGPIIWCVIFGVAGAVFYRLLEVSARVFHQSSETRTFAQSAQKMLNIFDWLPSRIIAIVFALGGHFSLVVATWRQQVKGSPWLPSTDILAACGNAGLGHTSVPTTASVPYLNDSMALLQRSIIFLMVIFLVLAVLL